jgi:hypothetical protein
MVGQPRHGKQLKRNAGIALSGEVIDLLNHYSHLNGISKSDLVEQILRGSLGLKLTLDDDEVSQVLDSTKLTKLIK